MRQDGLPSSSCPTPKNISPQGWGEMDVWRKL